MLLQHRHAVLKVLDNVCRRLVGLAKGERHGGKLPRGSKQQTVHLKKGDVRNKGGLFYAFTDRADCYLEKG